MAYKYKLVKELGPQDLKKAADVVGPYVMKDIIAKKLNYADFDELEKDLGTVGIDQNKIDQILDMWAQRAELMHMNEEDKKEDPFKTAWDEKMKKMFGPFNPENKKNTFKTPEEQGKEKLTQEVLRRLKNR
jgi:hypothetical protein